MVNCDMALPDHQLDTANMSFALKMPIHVLYSYTLNVLAIPQSGQGPEYSGQDLDSMPA